MGNSNATPDQQDAERLGFQKDPAPAVGKGEFICPWCGVFSEQLWSIENDVVVGSYVKASTNIARCRSCERCSVWFNSEMLYPDTSIGPRPNEDLPPNVIADYDEARAIAGRSPRAAAALLRLCLQKICQAAGEPGKNINDDLKTLVRKGLPVQVQQAADIVRIVGNNAVHPGELDVQDDLGTVGALFELINIIGDHLFTRSRQLQELWDKLPEGAKDAVARRDQPPTSPGLRR